MSENSAVEWGGDDKKQVLFYRPFYLFFLPSFNFKVSYAGGFGL